MEMGPASPEQSLPVSRMQNGGLSGQEKSLALANNQKNLKSAVAAANVRRFFGACSGAVRQDALVTENANEP